MMARPSRPAARDTEQPPPYYIATRPLFLGDQFTRAFNPGDQVPVEHVETYGWHDLVRRPDQPAPEQPQSEPETTTGQATTEGKGDA
jgi:hypothetical protein